MKNPVCKKIIKAVAVSALAFGLIGAAFIGANSTVFASNTSASESVMASAPSNVTPVTQTNAFAAQDLRVYDKTESGTTVSIHAISIDEAAQIGARYISDVFGADIDGMVVEMRYQNLQPHSLKSLFSGTVSNGTEVAFNFMLDALTGERMMVSRPANNATNADVSEAWAMMQRAAGSGQCAFPIELSQGELDIYLQVARDFAQKHFNNSNVADVSFTIALASAFDRDINGNMVKP